MKKLAILIVVVCFMFATYAPASSLKNMLFVVEFTKPIASVQTMSVVFRTRPTAQMAEQVVRDSMNMAIKYFPPQVEILGIAWFSADGIEGNETQIKFANGKSSLVFNPKTKTLSYL